MRNACRDVRNGAIVADMALLFGALLAALPLVYRRGEADPAG